MLRSDDDEMAEFGVGEMTVVHVTEVEDLLASKNLTHLSYERDGEAMADGVVDGVLFSEGKAIVVERWFVGTTVCQLASREDVSRRTIFHQSLQFLLAKFS